LIYFVFLPIEVNAKARFLEERDKNECKRFFRKVDFKILFTTALRLTCSRFKRHLLLPKKR